MKYRFGIQELRFEPGLPAMLDQMVCQGGNQLAWVTFQVWRERISWRIQVSPGRYLDFGQGAAVLCAIA